MRVAVIQEGMTMAAMMTKMMKTAKRKKEKVMPARRVTTLQSKCSFE